MLCPRPDPRNPFTKVAIRGYYNHFAPTLFNELVQLIIITPPTLFYCTSNQSTASCNFAFEM